MNPAKVERHKVHTLTDLPNIGKAMAADLYLLGIDKPEQLVGRDPYAMYQELCIKLRAKVDPCVIDVFIAVVRFMDGDSPRPWWHYTAERKKYLAEHVVLDNTATA